MTETSDPPVPAEEAATSTTPPTTEEATTTTTTSDANGASSDAPKKSEPIVSSSKKHRPAYKFDPDKITLRFLFANHDGLTVTVECNPSDIVSEVKAALLSVWPDDLPTCSSGDRLRLICMGKGILQPDTRTLEACQVPVFKTHPTPINVSIRPENLQVASANPSKDAKATGRAGAAAGGAGASTGAAGGAVAATDTASQGCACIIQ
eukprot:Nitzschia sp. Nitz4//scaffold101_size76361//3622//4322//NITZ4_005590-RA/size76361-augustus-gene-0.21-mRNA-1//-1//CDS//3329532122//5437//frame0